MQRRGSNQSHGPLWRGLVAALLAVIVTVGGFAGVARADGDPASDVLTTQPLFLPADAGVSAREQAQLLDVLRAAGRAGFPTRVAVIASGYDLGSVTALWHRPRVYARFLGIELSLVHRQPLLVVMPDGIGFSWPGHSTAATYRRLSGIRIGAGGAGLLTAAGTAVRTLAAADGHAIGPAPATRTPTTAHRHAGDTLAIAVVALAAIIAAAALARLLLLLRRRRPRPAAHAVPAAGGGRERPIRLRWAVPGLAALCCVGVGAPILILSLARGTPTRIGSAPSAAPVRATRVSAVATPYTWPAGRRRAPGFRLTGENGRRISLAAYRGRPVIVTFVDPLCRNLCPLAAHVLNQVDRDLPPARRPVILAVSVDIYADSHADLAQDFRRWDLVPQWHWAVGTPRQLAAVWKRYRVGVEVTTKRIAGTTVHFITHDEVAFVIDRRGDVRALYGWPYAPQNVEAELARMSRA